MHSSSTIYLEQPLLEQYLYHLLQDGQQPRVVHPDAPPQHGQRAIDLGQAAVLLWGECQREGGGGEEEGGV